MLKGLGDIGQIMKLQKEFKNIQKTLQRTEVQGQSADGTVKVRMNGEYKITGVELSDPAQGAPDRQKMEKMIASAVNDAVDKTREMAAQEMGKLTGGLNIPGLGNFLK
ncbi:MAG TPA: YbaB/EbfC family nucleoid-associated protein [Spirochaetes bacterium]|nr:YbaB/EbfC family nucleoid-associated protein [Spirochaetota bacterium]